MCKERSCVSRNGRGLNQRGFAGWEIVIACLVAFLIVAAGAVRLKKNYDVCLGQGYNLLECVLNTPL